MLDAVKPPAPVVDTGPAGAEPLVTVCYNGACPVCSREIAVYRRKAEAHGVPARWVDVSVPKAEAAAATQACGIPAGVGREGLLKRMHAVGADGRAVAGIDAFLVVWRVLPGYGWLARVAALPGVKPVLGWLYDHAAAPAIYRWHKHRERKGLVPSET
jgi:predicted DCC family thiol-disulfide oxidoreductase YuxK